MINEILEQDLRTDSEKRQDAFIGFLRSGNVGDRALIFFTGLRLKVEIISKKDCDWDGVRPGNKIVSLGIVANPLPTEDLGFNTTFGFDETELIRRIIK